MQVRNLASCVKVAVDFILPESLPQAFKFAQEFREMATAEATEVNEQGDTVKVAPNDRHSQDKLQAELSMCLAAVHAVEILQVPAAALHATEMQQNLQLPADKGRNFDVILDKSRVCHRDKLHIRA